MELRPSFEPFAIEESSKLEHSGTGESSWTLNPRVPVHEKVRDKLGRAFFLGLLAVAVLTTAGLYFIHPSNFYRPVVAHDVVSEEDCRVSCLSWTYARCDYLKFTIKTTHPHPNRPMKEAVCSFEVHPAFWAPYFVLGASILSLILILRGFAADIIFVGDSILFGAAGIISTDDAIAGFSSGAVVTIGFLMVVGAAVEETGLPDIGVAKVMGNSPNMYVGLFRMMFASAVMSMFMPNAALFLLFSPILSSWTTRLGLPKQKFFAPLGLALQVGGQCTLLGSATPMVARAVIDKNIYKITMFDLMPVGGCTAILMVIIGGLLVVLLPGDAPLPASDEEAVDPAANSPSTMVRQESCTSWYIITMLVLPSSGYDGAASQDVCAQIRRLPGVQSCETPSQGKLCAGSQIICECTGQGFTKLRYCTDIVFENNEHLLRLGTHRRKRHLYEVVVPASSNLVGQTFNNESMMEEYKACLVAIHGRKDARDQICDGDILLMEGEDEAVAVGSWVTSFSMVKMVPNSHPPRIAMGNGRRDQIRAAFVMMGFAVMVVAIAMEMLSCTLAAMLLALCFVGSGVLSVDQMFAAVKFRGLLIIVGCMGLATALQETGLAHFMVRELINLVLPFGVHATRGAIYALAAGLSMLVSKTATIAIIGPMMPDVAAAIGQSVPSMVWTAIFAAGACFVTPFGEPASIFILRDGQYSYWEFAKYGIPLQIIHGVLTVLLVALFCDVLEIG